MQEADNHQREKRTSLFRWKRVVPLLFIIMLLVGIAWPIHQALYANNQTNSNLITTGTWNTHNYDLVYTVAFSTAQRPDGPLVAYRASGADLQTTLPVVAVQRDSGGSEPASTPLFFPSPDGRYLALLTPPDMSSATNMTGASLTLVSTDGQTNKLLASDDVAEGDQPIWSADSTTLYYHTGVISETMASDAQTQTKSPFSMSGSEEVHSLGINGQDTVLWRRPVDDTSFRLIGVDKTGNLILSMAQADAAVELLRLSTTAGATQQPQLITTLPTDILPGNVLGIGADGLSVNCLRVTNWQPLATMQIQIGFRGQVSAQIQPLFATARFGVGLTSLAISADGAVAVMSHVIATRADLTAQGISGVPQQETLVLADNSTGASQRLALPPGGQVVQTFWSPHIAQQQVQAVPQTTIQHIFATPADSSIGLNNASVEQQDEWMLEAHAGLLLDSPRLSTMCYGNCAHGLGDPAHIAAAILHGVAYTESDWHQFNASGFQIDGETAGSPIESSDGGWGEYQQTWGMPPQCQTATNCRADVSKVESDEAYNIGVGSASLIADWNATAGVASASDPNDPFKANDWFFAVWAYNGAYGNNPNDVASNYYAHWYPGAPFRSVYEEYVWYFAAHPQGSTNHWTDSYLPALGTALLPPQQDFQNTSDSFVRCVTCTIPDWTSGSYDRDWVGQGAANATMTSAFRQLYSASGGEQVVGLPIDTGGGAAAHRWGSGWIQNMDGGSYQPGALMEADGSSTVYWVYGGIWKRYLQDGGCLSYPTSALVVDNNPSLGKDSYYIQTFQHGQIVWDATTLSVVSTSC